MPARCGGRRHLEAKESELERTDNTRAARKRNWRRLPREVSRCRTKHEAMTASCMSASILRSFDFNGHEVRKYLRDSVVPFAALSCSVGDNATNVPQARLRGISYLQAQKFRPFATEPSSDCGYCAHSTSSHHVVGSESPLEYRIDTNAGTFAFKSANDSQWRALPCSADCRIVGSGLRSTTRSWFFLSTGAPWRRSSLRAPRGQH